MSRAVVTIGGPPGSGKSTAGRLAAERLGLTYRSAGEVFREEARRRGMSLAEFGRYAEAHPEVDRELDRAMRAFARPGVLLEGRVQGPLLRREGVPVRYIVITAGEDERARRLARRDGESVGEALRSLREREASERDRYQRYYGIDLDRERPDLVVDSSERTPEEVAETVEAFVRARDAADGP